MELFDHILGTPEEQHQHSRSWKFPLITLALRLSLRSRYEAYNYAVIAYPNPYTVISAHHLHDKLSFNLTV